MPGVGGFPKWYIEKHNQMQCCESSSNRSVAHLLLLRLRDYHEGRT